MGSESRSVEEEDVLRMICECLDLRETYVYWEMVEPWMREVVVESNTSEMSSDPFHFEPAEATAVSYSFHVYVVRIILGFQYIKLRFILPLNAAIHLFVNAFYDILVVVF